MRQRWGDSLQMKVRYLGESWGISLTKNKIYECLDFEHGFMRIIDDTDEPYYYASELFDIINNEDENNDLLE